VPPQARWEFKLAKLHFRTGSVGRPSLVLGRLVVEAGSWDYRLVKSLALAAALFVTAAALASGASSGGKMLYGCAYVTNLGSSSDVNVLIWDKAAPRHHGWVMFRGSGINKKDNFVLDSHGWHTEKFNVTTFGDENITVAIPDLKLSYSFIFKLNAASDITSKGCTPH
jgi:hypothetical protein